MLKSVRKFPSKVHKRKTKVGKRNRTNGTAVVDEETALRGQRDGLDLLYTIHEDPPWYTCIILGFQHYLTMFGATMAYPLLLAIPFCIEDNALAKGDLMSTIFFMSGISTLLQTTFGCRLPIVQGGTFTFLVPTIAILSLDKYKCPAKVSTDGDLLSSTVGSDMANATTVASATTPAPYLAGVSDEISQLMVSMAMNATTLAPTEEELHWTVRMREIQGAIIVSSLFQIVIGFTGIIGFMLRYIGPLAIAPTIALIGFSLFGAAGRFAGAHWWITSVTFVLLIVFSQFLKDVETPVPAFTRKKGCYITWWPAFKLFPVILTVLVAWILCAIFTATDVFPNDPNNWQYGARTDRYSDVVAKADWFTIPYPGQWGVPIVSAAGVFGMLAGVIASMIESIGDYYACARMSGAPPPPSHAVNRGIGVEGFCCLLAGAWGSGTGTTSYSENVGAIGITKVGSRRVIQWGAVMMLFFSIFGKFGAFFSTIPDPIIGGVLAVTFAMVTAVGLSNLQFVDLNSSRNLFIIGFSFFLGTALPSWASSHPDGINTGSVALDNIFTVLLSTSMFVGGFTGFILDNTIPGTPKERGLLIWKEMTGEHYRDTEDDRLRCYDLPFGMDAIRKAHWTRYIPFCPTFQECFQPKEIPEPQSEEMVTVTIETDEEKDELHADGGITDKETVVAEKNHLSDKVSSSSSSSSDEDDDKK